MDPILLGQAALNGFLFGGVYSLMAVGLSLIFGVMRVINIAHGDMMVWGSYLAFILAFRLGLDPFVSFVLCAAALFCLGVVVQRGLVNRVLNAPHEMQILLMLGVALVLENLALVVFGPDTRRTESAYGLATVWFGPIFVDVARLITFALALALSCALYLFLFRSDLGKLIRAAADNGYGALVIGADVERIYTVAFGIGAACVGAAGALMSALLPFSPAAGFAQTVTSFNIVIIGGMGSLLGAFLGGLIVAVAESLGAVLLVPSLKELVGFVLLVLILLFRPQGLFGGKTP
ncbi:MAG: branched-chain amino acid ABC transporter permease [Candidatus Rokubacteria bacterium]|nr:branched-chain amino acid ABC transporter permease [Candidatus Rokubacteria bacterium]MBI2555459.1 branched-chain amino acid ABC transporter permease [Candidatus Rokubacteria bacterium]